MRFLTKVCAIPAAALFVLAGVGRADTVVRPSDLTGPTFGYDASSLAPTAETGQAALGIGAFTASVTNGSHSDDPSQAGQGGRYRTFRVSLDSLFSNSSLKVSDLTAFSYANEQLSGSNAWRISIYAGPSSGTTFYTSRIQAFPTDGVIGSFQTESSGSLLFTDNGQGTGPKFNNVDYATALADDGNQALDFVDITLGADTGGGTESANLDDVTFTVDGQTATLDLEPNAAAAPLPNSAWAGFGLLGMLGIGAFARRKRATT